jgi:uncharacterized SAM-binding protein YcdF (DUF218 family)
MAGDIRFGPLTSKQAKGGAAIAGATTAIVIFGAAVRLDGSPSTTLRRRVEAAAAFGRTLPGVLYVPTGAVGRHGPSEASVMAELLKDLGVAAGQIVLEETATDTLSSVRAVRRLVAGRTVYAATSAYHLPRCVALLRLAGVPARACPPPRVPAARSFRRRWFWRLREGAALPYDAALVLLLRLTGRL